MKLSKFVVSVDSVIFGYAEGSIFIPLFKRSTKANDPYSDHWSLTGGPIGELESFEHACRRKLKEDLGLEVEYLEQLYTFGDPQRDPRDRAISVAYYALTKLEGDTLEPGSHTNNAQWFPIQKLPKTKWAFDHKIIVETAIKRLKAKITYEPIGFNLLEEEFSMPQLQSLYEAILERQLDRRNFAKKILSFNFLTPTRTHQAGRGRPTQLYRFDQKQYQHLQKEGFVFEI